MIDSTTNRLSPNGYWPAGMDEVSKAASIATFERQIFPIWRGVEERDKETEEKMSAEEVNAPSQVMFECSTMHRQDLAIHSSGRKPNRSGGDQERAAYLRKKDSRARST